MQEHFAPPPPPALRPYVSRIVGYRLSGFAPGRHVGLPGPFLTVVVPFGDPIVVSAPDGPPLPYTALASGMYDRAVVIHHDGHQHGIQLDLTPAGARALLGVPAGELAGVIVELDDLLPRADRRLAEHAAEGGTWQDQVDVVLDALTRRLAGDHVVSQPRPEVAHAWDEIRRSHGCVPVWSVASSVGWSTRHLGEKFLLEYGISPKTAARMVRFDRAHRMVSAGVPLAETAGRCGYVDQAHLNRDWRSFAGLSPTRWAAEDELAFVQDRDRSSR